jgi:tetratricopeptide (TPR) repeat protein
LTPYPYVLGGIPEAFLEKERRRVAAAKRVWEQAQARVVAAEAKQAELEAQLQQTPSRLESLGQHLPKSSASGNPETQSQKTSSNKTNRFFSPLVLLFIALISLIARQDTYLYRSSLSDTQLDPINSPLDSNSRSETQSISSDDLQMSEGLERLMDDYQYNLNQFNSAADYNRQGFIHTQEQDYRQAIEYYEKAIQVDPNFENAYLNRGNAYLALEEHQKAIQSYTEAIQVHPESFTAYNSRGFAYSDSGNYERAIRDYDEAIRLNPEFHNAYQNRGFAYRKIGDFHQALEDYSQAIQLNPESYVGYQHRGITYRILGNYERAIADYNQAIRLNPDYANIYNNRGNAYRFLGHLELAIADYNEAIKLRPDFHTFYNNRGHAYLDLGKQELADLDFKTSETLR